MGARRCAELTKCITSRDGGRGSNGGSRGGSALARLCDEGAAQGGTGLVEGLTCAGDVFLNYVRWTPDWHSGQYRLLYILFCVFFNVTCVGQGSITHTLPELCMLRLLIRLLLGCATSLLMTCQRTLAKMRSFCTCPTRHKQSLVLSTCHCERLKKLMETKPQRVLH